MWAGHCVNCQKSVSRIKHFQTNVNYFSFPSPYLECCSFGSTAVINHTAVDDVILDVITYVKMTAKMRRATAHL